MRIAPGVFRLTLLCLAGLLFPAFPGPVWGQERELRGGHSECPCAVCRKKREGRKKQPQRKPAEAWRGGARVVTAQPTGHGETGDLPSEMGFRSLNREAVAPKQEAAPEPEVTGGESRIDQAAEAARKRRAAREQDPPKTPLQVLADLRIGSDAFRRADYEGSVLRFKSAAEGAPDDAAPLMALAQAHIALGRDGPAARAIRKAVRLRPELLRTRRAVASAYREAVEFDRVMEALEVRAAKIPSNADSKFVLAVQRFFTGDARCRETFAWLLEAVPGDQVAALFVEASVERFGVQLRSDEAGMDSARNAEDES